MTPQEAVARFFDSVGPADIDLDQPAFNRKRLKAEKLIDSKVPEQLIRVQGDAGCSGERPGRGTG
jgi:hypothetical protein